MALPIPCMPLNIISMAPSVERAQKMELAAMMMFPIRNIFFRPLISASFPRGTRKIAEERRKAMATQLMPTAPMENSSLMAGRAMLMAAPRKGLMKEVMIIRKRISFLEEGRLAVILLVLQANVAKPSYISMALLTLFVPQIYSDPVIFIGQGGVSL